MPTITGVGVLASVRHFIERKIEAFRAGPGHRIPDLLTDFGRKVDAFFSQFACFGGGGQEKPLTVVAQRQPEGPVPKRAVGPPPGRSETLTDGDKLAALEQPLMLPRKKDETEPAPKADPAPVPDAVAVPSLLDKAVAFVNEFLEEPPKLFVPTADAMPDAVAEPSLFERFATFIGEPKEEPPVPEPPVPEPPPPFRPRIDWAQKREEFAKLSDPPRVGRRPEPPPTPVQQPEEHLEPAILKNWQIPKAPPIEEKPAAPKQKAPKPPVDPNELAFTLDDPDAVPTPADLQKAEKLVMLAALRAETDALKESEATARRELAETGASEPVEELMPPRGKEPEPGHVAETARPKKLDDGQIEERRRALSYSPELASAAKDREAAAQKRDDWENRLLAEFDGTAPPANRRIREAKKDGGPTPDAPLPAAELRIRARSEGSSGPRSPKRTQIASPPRSEWPKPPRQPIKPPSVKSPPPGILGEPKDPDDAPSGKTVGFRLEGEEMIDQELVFDNRIGRALNKEAILALKVAMPHSKREANLERWHEQAMWSPRRRVNPNGFIDSMCNAQGAGHAHELAWRFYEQFQSTSPSTWAHEAERTIRNELKGRLLGDALKDLGTMLRCFEPYDAFKRVKETEYQKVFDDLRHLGKIVDKIHKELSSPPPKPKSKFKPKLKRTATRGPSGRRKSA